MAKRKKRKSDSTGFGIHFDSFQGEKLCFVLGVVLFGLAIWVIVSFASYLKTGGADISLIEYPRPGEITDTEGNFANACSSVGAYTAHFFIKKCFGLSAFIIPLFLLVLSLKLMRAYNPSILKWLLSSALIMIWASITLSRFFSPFFTDSFYNTGGDHGLFVGGWIESVIGTPGLLALLIVVALCFLAYVSAQTLYLVRKILNPVKFITDKVKFTITNKEFKEAQGQAQDDGETDDNSEVAGGQDSAESESDNKENEEEVIVEPSDLEGDRKEKDENNEPEGQHETKKTSHEQVPADEVKMDVQTAKTEEKAAGRNLVKVGDKELPPYDPKRDLENYRYPTLDLLKKYDNDGKPFIDMSEQNANKNRIVDVLRNFGVEISSIKATIGPTITLYEITPAQGVKISKIRNLEDDIALSLSALGIRIIAPIPGKGTIGIEVPNAKPNVVSMESILNSKKFQETTMDLPCAIGKTITNEVFMFDLAKLPHLLVAGATGQGKSVGLNAIITSLLYKKHPAELKIVLIDPKKVEFSIYGPISKHFLAMVPDDEEDPEPIITDVTKVVRTLNSLCKEMDSRYDLLKLAGSRNVKEYNRKFTARQLNPDNGHRFMPYIVVIIDEFGDLIMTAGKEIEMPIARIAQLARAVGIHMIIATQRPTTTIITGNIKANFPGRMAFKVSAMIDSKTILDRPGANRLIGRGDMLFLNGNEPVRVQCAFVDTPEVESINGYISKQQGYPSTFALPEPDSAEEDGGSGSKDVDMQRLDPLFKEAAKLVVLNQTGSTSLVQRKFSIGYNRAGRIMDQLEHAGVVGAASGSKPRDVLIVDLNTLENLFSSLK